MYSVRVVIGSLTVGVFFGGIGGGVAFPTLPTLRDVLGITPFFVGIILSTNQFSRLVANTPVGQVIDNIGAKKPMVVGLIMQGVAPFGYIAGMYPEYVPFAGPVPIFIVAQMF